MIKLIICLILTTFSFLCGNEFFCTQKRRLKSLKELKEIVGEIIVSVGFLSLDVYDICKRVFANRHQFDYSAFSSISSGDFPSRWVCACETSLLGLTEEDKATFQEIGAVLGSYDSESQIKKLEYIEKTLEKSYSEKALALESRQKLYYTVSVSCGLLICLIIA